MSKLLFLSFPLIVLAGCNEYELVSDNSGNADLGNDGAPDIMVDPEVVNFGALDVGDGTEITEVVTVYNEGDADLHIQDIYLKDADAPFSIGAISSVLIQAGGSAQFTVTFSPDTSADDTTQVLIESDDPDEAVTDVDLLGSGVAPIIDVTPSDYDFGTLYIGCDAEQPVTISNVGNADLIVEGFDLNTGSADFSFDANEGINGALPWTIGAGDSLEVYVDYDPYDEYSDVAYLMISSNDPYTPEVMAVQEGNGEIYGTNLDLFEQPLKGSTDIIFAVDKSCSMSDDITNVQNNFGTFVSTLSGLDADYQVAAVIADNGCISGDDLYIDNSFSEADAQSSITSMITATGSYGSNTERAFMLLEATLSEASSGGCNDGLVREEATLNLVGISDEPEQSVNSYSYYVSLFQSLKSDPDDVIMHAIGGDYPSGCGSASAYTGFYEATVATGGLFLSICATDFGAHLEALAEGSAADLNSFELTEWPVPETISVKIDGVTTTIGWEYNTTDNAIDFDGDYVPEGGSTIEVDYSLYGDCDQ